MGLIYSYYSNMNKLILFGLFALVAATLAFPGGKEEPQGSDYDVEPMEGPLESGSMGPPPEERSESSDSLGPPPKDGKGKGKGGKGKGKGKGKRPKKGPKGPKDSEDPEPTEDTPAARFF